MYEIFKIEDKDLILLVFLLKRYNIIRIFLLVKKIILDFGETVLVFFEIDKLMKEDLRSSIGDGRELMAIGYAGGNRKDGKAKYRFFFKC